MDMRTTNRLSERDGGYLPSHSSQFDAFVTVLLHFVQDLPGTEAMSRGGSDNAAGPS